MTAGHGFDSAAFFVSPENAFLHWSVSGFFFFFCTHCSISHLFISLWKEVNALFLTQGYCEVKEMHLFYELAVLLVSMIFSPVIP